VADVENIVDGCERVEVAGPDGPRAWSLAHVTPGIRAEFSAWAKLRARREIPQGEHSREDVAVFQERCAAGDYTWGGPLDPRRLGSAVGAVLATDEGMVRVLQLLLRKAHGEVSGDEAVRLLREGGHDVADALCRALGLPPPNRPAPVPTADPGPQKTTPDPTPTPG
jgi:hypothetical protein